jgi:hypothetical protein
MAIYHLSVKPISRGAGRSATAAAAYRSGELVHDVTSDEVFDYTRKRGVEHSEIVLPASAAKLDINWGRDRQALWNAAEVAENRSNSRVAREYEIALPHELNKLQRVALVREFAGEIADRYGVAVDFAIHAPHRSGDTRNHHAHLMATTRTVERAGLGDKVSIEWSDGNRRKAGLVPGKEEIKDLRGRWAEITNEHLQARGLDIRVDHRSLEAQGIAREPTSHLGPAVSGMERRGIETEVGKRIAWEREFAAQVRLEKAAELGKLEREQASVQRSMLDLSGDLMAARRERDRGLGAGAQELRERSGMNPQQRGIFDGFALDEKSLEVPRERVSEAPDREALTPAADPNSATAKLTPDELQAQARQRGLLDLERVDASALRGTLARDLSLKRPSAQRSPDRPAEASPKPKSPALDLEQIKAQGRAALQDVKQALQAEKVLEQQRALEREREAERSRGRSRGWKRIPGDEDGLHRGRGPGDDAGLGRGRGRGR